MANKQKGRCSICGQETARHSYKYCSNKCQMDSQYLLYIKRWKNSGETGLQGHGVVSRHIKRYLREKFGNKCCLCGWAKVNPISDLPPLVADHIDGNWRNNIETNLRLLCPNCDALSPTYAGHNRGKGRKNRIVSNRVKEGRLFVISAQSIVPT